MEDIIMDVKSLQKQVASESNPQSSKTQDVIGKGSPRNTARKTLLVQVPLIANVESVRAYMRSSPWPNGEDRGPENQWKLCKLDSYYEPYGWCRAGFPKSGTTHKTQWFSAVFENWLTTNPREGKLVVTFTIPKTSEEEVTINEIRSNLIQVELDNYEPNKG